MSKNKHLGSNFDDFLQAEGLLVDAQVLTIKRILVEALGTGDEQTTTI
jgi:hypothetical protein